MATLVTEIPQLVFPYELDNIRIQQTGEDHARVAIQIGGGVVFDNTLYFDFGGFIDIFMVSDFLRTYTTRESKEVQFLIDGAVAATTTCIPCDVRLTEKAVDFCKTHFLSLGQDKVLWTARNGRVFFSFYNDGSTETATVTNTIVVEGEGLKDVVFKTATYSQEGILNFYLDMKEVLGHDNNVLRTAVRIGERKVLVYVYPEEVNDSHMTVVFGNAFNQLESFDFCKCDKSLKPKFETAVVYGMEKNIRVTRVREYKCFSGMLSGGEMHIFEDLAESIAVYRYPSMEPLVITAVDCNQSSDKYTPWKGNITFRDTDSIPIYQPYKEPRTFDQTFDLTFK